MFPSPGHEKLSGEGCINCLKHTGKPAPSLLIYAAISARELTPVALGRWSRAFPSRDPPPPPGKGESPFNGKVSLTLAVSASGGREPRLCCTQKGGVLPRRSQSLSALIFSNNHSTVTSTGGRRQAAQRGRGPGRGLPGRRGAFPARLPPAPTEVNTCTCA